MSTKFLLMTGVLALSSLSIANAKSYMITVDNPAKAGNVTLQPGNYKVKVEGTNAVFKDVQTDKTFTTPVKIDNTGKKHENTAVLSTTKDGTEQIQHIELGGSDETIDFGD